MAAIVHPRGHEDRHPTQQPGGRPDLRLVPGGRRTPRPVRRAPMAVVYRRRRVVAAGLAAVALVVILLAAQGLGSLLAGPGAPAEVRSETSASGEVIVQPGDTYWSIAADLDRGGDIRRTVDQLVDVNDGRALEAGDRITIPG